MHKISDSIKSFIIITLVILLGTLASSKLMKLQIVGENELASSHKYDSGAFTFEREVSATRGEIIDYSGNVIIGNDSRCDIVLQKAFFPDDLQEGNQILLEIYNALLDNKYIFEEVLPITFEEPYEYKEEDVSRTTELLNLNVYATAENCIDKLISDYQISDKYSAREKRMIAGMRYAMLEKEFSYSNDLILATDVDDETVIHLKELSNLCKGVEAVNSAERTIVRGDILPHEIGTVGPIWAEEYDELKEKGYAMNDTVGRSGIEYAMEKELRGESGTEEVTILDGSIVDIRTTKETVPGQTVKLTVDGAFQSKLQGVLDNFLANYGWYNGEAVTKGALVVLNAKTGAVLGMANAPTYNLKDFAENYDELLEADGSPMFDRCTQGLYLPGSTFKTITATAGLNEGIVDGGTSFYCGRYYDFYGGSFQCTGSHSYISARRAIEVSCNIYFYELSAKLGIDNITKYAELYGLGSSLGLETGDEEGFLCNPETFAKRNQEWYIGYVIQAGIGNQDYGITPLQLATVANTIANRGVRYKPYLVDSLYTYGSNKLVRRTKPEIAEEIELSNDSVYDYIIGGMQDAAKNVPYPYSLSNLGYSVAIKTGTPQTSQDNKSKQNSVFIGFAPADDPEIAFAGVIEGGEYSKYMVRGILDAYNECYGINGAEPAENSKELPPEMRNGTTDTTVTTTTTTTETTTTTTANTTTATATATDTSRKSDKQSTTGKTTSTATTTTTVAVTTKKRDV
ncbi:MAG: penicillin-binding transpeptidase domain-containing protein [Ruminococcus flavefaciens]|nr:penicillin-binding transpeptidase domain-containing protein [Ruminococcus flavefaciens]MCM1229031.1 penicillin-binding transpeptidase domain-containing protein [Ruminococcus flavefaciens]